MKRNSWVFWFHLFLNILFSLCFKVVADATLTGFFCSSSNSVVGGRKESLWRLGTSPAHIGFMEVCASAEEPPKEIKGSGPGKREAKVEIHLDESLLDSLMPDGRK